MTNEGKEIINAVQEMMMDLKKNLNERMDVLENGQREIKMTLENEIRPNIQLLAEGHKQSAEKLDKLESLSEDVEYIRLKTDVIEAVTKVQAYDINYLKRVK